MYRVSGKGKYPEQGDTQLACIVIHNRQTVLMRWSFSRGCIDTLHPFESDGLDEKILNLYHCQIRLGLSQAPMQRDGGRLRRA